MMLATQAFPNNKSLGFQDLGPEKFTKFLRRLCERGKQGLHVRAKVRGERISSEQEAGDRLSRH